MHLVLLAAEDGDFSDNGVVSVLVLNAIIIAVVFIVYSILQRSSKYDYAYFKRSSRKNGPNQAGKLSVRGLGVPELVPRPPGFVGWVTQTYNTTLTEVMARSGLDAAAYLLFLRNLSLSFLLVGILCAGTLMGVNSIEDENQQRDLRNDEEVLDLRGFADWTTSNVHPKSHLLWIHLGVLLVSVAAVFWSIVSTIRDYAVLRDTYKAHRVADVAAAASSHTVALSPAGAAGSAGWPGRAAVERFVSSASGARAHAVVSAVDAPALLEARAKEDAARDGLEHAKSWFKVKGERELVKVGRLAPVCGSKVDAIEHFTEELESARKEIRRIREEEKLPDTGVRFVIMESEADALALVAACPAGSADIGGSPYEVKPAPRPDAVAWNNLRFNLSARRVRRAIMAVFIAILCVFWSLPIAFLSSLEQIASIPGVGSAFEKLLDLDPVILGVIAAYLPTIVAIILNAIILLLIRKFANYEGHHSDPRIYTRSQQIFYAFTVSSTVIFPALAVGVLASAASLAEDFEDNPTDSILDLLSQIVAPKSGYFVAYTIQLAFVGTIIKLLRLGPLIVSGFKLSRSVTPEDRERALTVAPFKFWVEYGFALLIASIVLLFSLTVPIITCFGWIYFLLKYAVDKTTLVNTFPPVFTENGALLVSALNRVVFGIVLSLASAVILFISKEAYGQLVIAVVLLLATPVYWLYSGRGVKAKEVAELEQQRKIAQKAPPADSADLDIFAKSYEHPGFRPIRERREELSEEYGVAKRGVVAPTIVERSLDSSSVYSSEVSSYDSEASYSASYDSDNTASQGTSTYSSYSYN